MSTAESTAECGSASASTPLLSANIATKPKPSPSAPLLPSDHRLITSLRTTPDHIARLLHPDPDSRLHQARHRLQRLLSSKYGHYSVLALVSLDVAGIFATFLISLHVCEHARQPGFDARPWERADQVLDVASLVFSCLFLFELMLSVFAFGWRYFGSKFHCFDATVIVAGFIVDVLLKGPVEEAGSLIVVGRLWRVFKIIEEFSAGADDRIEELEERVGELEKACEMYQGQNEVLMRRVGSNGKGGAGAE